MDKGLGLVATPPSGGTPSVELILGVPGALPEQFVVPAFRGWFDTSFQVIPGNVAVTDQGPIPSCVGHATAHQKSAQERVRISPRDIYRQAKRLDGTNDPTSYGTSFAAAQDVLTKNGAAEEKLVPDLPNVPLADYVSLTDVSEVVTWNRGEHKGKSSFFVQRTLLRQTLLQTEQPIVTGCQWYAQDNGIGTDGIMRLPAGTVIAGHAFACIGWVIRPGVGECLVMVNSFGKGWGHHGLFFVPTADVLNRLYEGYVAVDIGITLAELLRRYDGKNVMVPGTPDIYRCELGVLRKWPDEITWWAFGNLFGFDVYEIPSAEFDAIPKGIPMDIKDAPFRTRELVRQIRQHFGAT